MFLMAGQRNSAVHVFRRILRWFALALAMGVLSGCAAVSSHPGQPGVIASGPIPVSAMSPRAQSHYHVLAAEFALENGRNKFAAQQYLDALRLQPSADLAQRTIRIAKQAKDPALFQQAVKQWVQIEPDSEAAWRAATGVDLAEGRRDAALQAAQKVLQLDKKGVGAAMRKLAHLFGQAKQHQGDAMAVMDQLVQNHEDMAAAHYAKGFLALRFGLLDTAEKSADKAVSLDPGMEHAYLLKAGINIQRGRIKQASHIMNMVFARSPSDLSLRNHYARLLLNAHQEELAAEQFRKVLQQDPDNADALYASGLLALKDKRDKDAHDSFLRLLHTGRRTDQAAYYLGRIAEHSGDYESALNWYRQVNGGPQALDAVFRRANLMARMGHLQQAVQFLAGIRGRNPEVAAQMYQMEGKLLYSNERYDQAVGLYHDAVADFPRNQRLRYYYALTLQEQSRGSRARQELRTLIDQDPDDGRALNALGYMLTNQTGEYVKARKYIRRALKLAPDDPAVLDSMGWVEHKLGNDKKALSYLNRAYEGMRDPAVALHLGHVLWALGRHQDALEVWRRAQKKAPDNDDLKSAIENHQT